MLQPCFVDRCCVFWRAERTCVPILLIRRNASIAIAALTNLPPAARRIATDDDLSSPAAISAGLHLVANLLAGPCNRNSDGPVGSYWSGAVEGVNTDNMISHVQDAASFITRAIHADNMVNMSSTIYRDCGIIGVGVVSALRGALDSSSSTSSLMGQNSQCNGGADTDADAQGMQADTEIDHDESANAASGSTHKIASARKLVMIVREMLQGLAVAGARGQFHVASQRLAGRGRGPVARPVAAGPWHPSVGAAAYSTVIRSLLEATNAALTGVHSAVVFGRVNSFVARFSLGRAVGAGESAALARLQEQLKRHEGNGPTSTGKIKPAAKRKGRSKRSKRASMDDETQHPSGDASAAAGSSGSGGGGSVQDGATGVAVPASTTVGLTLSGLESDDTAAAAVAQASSAQRLSSFFEHQSRYVLYLLFTAGLLLADATTLLAPGHFHPTSPTAAAVTAVPTPAAASSASSAVPSSAQPASGSSPPPSSSPLASRPAVYQAIDLSYILQQVTLGGSGPGTTIGSLHSLGLPSSPQQSLGGGGSLAEIQRLLPLLNPILHGTPGSVIGAATAASAGAGSSSAAPVASGADAGVQAWERLMAGCDEVRVSIEAMAHRAMTLGC